MLDPALCRRRQARLVELLKSKQLVSAVITSRPNVYWLTGYWGGWLHEAAVILTVEGRLTLIVANEPTKNAAADEVQAYPANRFATQRLDQPATIATTLRETLSIAAMVGFDASAAASQLILNASQTFVPLDDDLYRLRRRKESDELALMLMAVDCTRAMHERARQMIEPGIEEVAVYSELQSVAVRTAGEQLTPSYLGNDFACGPAGGGPRPGRRAQAGEIYVLDLGPGYRGYFADNCRAYSVDRKPTDVQLQAAEAIQGVFPIIESMAKPGVRCELLFEAARDHLRDKTGRDLIHHLGHGVGLFPHEYPHLNPEWPDVLEAGDVFTVEPGLYGQDINGGIRLENQYYVTATGVKNLTPFPMDLV